MDSAQPLSDQRYSSTAPAMPSTAMSTMNARAMGSTRASSLPSMPTTLTEAMPMASVWGKMISPQTLAIGMASVKVVGIEGKLARVLPIALAFMVLMAVLGMAGAVLL